MKNYQYILFDWDGNLAKTLDIWLVAKRAALEGRGIHVSDKIIATQCFGRPTEGFTELGVKDVDAAIFEMDQLAKKLMPEVDLYPDALFVLEALKQEGKQTALITTSLRNNVHHLLDKYKLHNLFDVTVTYEDTTKHKPYPEPLEMALKMLDGDKEKAVMIGDSDKDIGAANNAGIDSILFYPDAHEKFYDLNELQALRPTHVVRDFRQVIDIV